MKITANLIAVAIVLLTLISCGQNKEKKNEETPESEMTPETEMTTETDMTPSTETASLTSGYWKLIELKGNDVTEVEMTDEASLIFFKEESRIAGSNGCNRIGGFYTVDENQLLSFSRLMNTQMACPPNDIEGPFMDVMETTESYTISGDTLSLHNPSSTGPLAVFVLDPTKDPE